MIFVDTSEFLAVENRLDTHHSRALSLRDAWLKEGQALAGGSGFEPPTPGM
jgi:predicted nucleic acid-binding protein